MEQVTEAPPGRAERHDDLPPRRHIGLFVVLLLFLVVVGVVAWAGGRYRTCRTAPVSNGQTVSVEVPQGATGDDVVQLLADKGLINCGGFLGNLLLRGTGKADDTIYAGTYHLQVGMSLDRILTALTTKPIAVPTVKLTVPEGLRIASTYPGERSVASEVQAQTGIPAKKFVAVADSGKYVLPGYMPKGAKTPEGFLFPETYQLVKKGLTAQAVIKEMLGQFKKEADGLHLSEGAKRLGMTPYEVVIVASMIEREAKIQHDRPLIASVIYNRLKLGMTLGIDAT
ncbi:MAG: endolytic transglycosylase MltG, partial [Actinomycetota bacterium]